MQDTINKPIFIVGSPRSGTSILTWCLGQHPNIFPVDESTGIGELALALAVCYRDKNGFGPRLAMERDERATKTNSLPPLARPSTSLFNATRLTLSESGGNRPSRQMFRPTIRGSTRPRMPQKRGGSMERRHIRFTFAGCVNFSLTRCSFTSSATSTSVVRSMLNFHRLAGVSLVANEQESLQSLVPLSERLSLGRTRLRAGGSIPIASRRPCGSPRDFLEGSVWLSSVNHTRPNA